MEIDPDARCDNCTFAIRELCDTKRANTATRLREIDALELGGSTNGTADPKDLMKVKEMTETAHSLGRLGCTFKMGVIFEQLSQYESPNEP